MCQLLPYSYVCCQLQQFLKDASVSDPSKCQAQQRPTVIIHSHMKGSSVCKQDRMKTAKLRCQSGIVPLKCLKSFSLLQILKASCCMNTKFPFVCLTVFVQSSDTLVLAQHFVTPYKWPKRNQYHINLTSESLSI